MNESKTLFNGQVAVITGGASGIGLATAHLIAERGGTVVVMDINNATLSQVKSDLKLGDNQIHKLDIGDEGAIKAAIAKVFKDFGRIDVLVNTAAIVGPSNVKIEDVSSVDLERTVRINLFGSIWLTQTVLPIMKSQKYGRIVLVASIAGKEGNPGLHAYNASKAGLIGFVKGVGKEVATDGITVNAVAPAVIRTPMNKDTSDETLKYMIARIPMGRLGEPEEVGEIIAFAASRACSFTTGFTFDSSGGRATY